MSGDQSGSDLPDLSNDALVIRGGLMELGPLRNALQTSYVERLMSTNSRSLQKTIFSVEEIVEAAQQPHPRLPQRKTRVSTVGKLRKAGYEVVREGISPHVVLRFDVSPTDNELEELTKLFDPPIDNPSSAK